MSFKLVAIKSRTENKYRHVRFTQKGARCDCPAFVFHDKKDCWHIQQAKKQK